jgi:N-terminal domain of anti-restriction factor ArdC/IrrE N-terminal-like domain
MKNTDALELLEQGIKNLANQDNWLNHLKTQAVFHSYSFNNTCLIIHQCPDASRVAGFHAWKKLNRTVKKGETGIRILAPMVHKNTEDTETVRVSFRSVAVFDVSQTEGEPLPEIATRLEGDDNGVLGALKEFAISKGFEVIEEDMGETNGSCSYRSPIRITLNHNRSLLQQAKTLAHELGHALLHCGENYTGHDAKSAMELEAESVAFIVLQHFGVDSGDYSFGYISHWVASGADLEPVIAQLKESGVKIQKATNEIISAIDSFTPKAIASSDKLVSTPKPQEYDDDDVFQLDVAEILAARRELANCSIDSKRDKVLALASG